MTAPEQSRVADLGMVATAAAGAAELRDKRVIADRRNLIAAMVRVMKRDHAHPTVDEAVQAVTRFYDTDTAGDAISGESFVATLRRLRLQVVRDQEVIETHHLVGREAQEWSAGKDAILAWDCPTCGAIGERDGQPGERCLNPLTKLPYSAPGHPARMRLAYPKRSSA